MSVKLLREAFCDRCKKYCSDMKLTENKKENKIKTYNIESEVYSFVEVFLCFNDSRFEKKSPYKFCLCNDCCDELVQWLKNGENCTSKNIIRFTDKAIELISSNIAIQTDAEKDILKQCCKIIYDLSMLGGY